MYRTPEGKDIFVVDGHTHFWDGSPENQKNIHGKQFIECFYAYHTGLSPKEQLWEKSKFEKYSADDLYRDLFIDGPDDVAIVQSSRPRRGGAGEARFEQTAPTGREAAMTPIARLIPPAGGAGAAVV